VRGNHLPQQISEFASSEEVPLLQVPKCSEHKCEDGRFSKIIRHTELGEIGAHTILRIYRTPTQFHEEAKLQRHPIDMMTSTANVLKQNIFWILTTPPHDMARFRLQQLLRIKDLSESLSAEEE
jgi:hypothetical protein